MQRFFVDAEGNYLGSYDGPDSSNPFSSSNEVSLAPDHASQKWNGSTWNALVIDTPSIVPMRQARLALLRTGRLAAVNAAVAAADEETKITWEYSQEVHRAHPLVATLAVALSLTEQDLDDLFTMAATL